MECLHKGTQVELGLSSLFKVLYPTLHNESIYDLNLNLPKYAALKEIYTAMPLVRSTHPVVNPMQTPSATRASSSKDKPAISDAFKEHRWYPERRPGRGPKYPKTDLDR